MLLSRYISFVTLVGSQVLAAPVVPEDAADLIPEDAKAVTQDLELDARSNFEKRATYVRKTLNCGGNMFTALKSSAMSDLVNEMRRMNYQYNLSRGPAQCQRAVCLGKAAAYVCNDNGGPISVHSSQIAAAMKDILNQCFATQEWAAGQVFSGGNWNVYVKSDDHWC